MQQEDRMDKIEARPVDPRFVEAMEAGLEHGRSQGRVGWDTSWVGEELDYGLLFQSLMDKFDEEYHEFLDTLIMGQEPDVVRREAADVANVAMMLADLVETKP
jgi:hypothetical protein